MAGMLHDVGMLVLWALRPQQMAGHAVGSAELIDHHEHCGQLVMQAWQLPGWLQQVVALHHHGALPEDTTGTLCLITRVAEALSSRMGYGLAAEAGEVGDEELEPAGSTLGMDEAALARLAESLPEQIDQFNSALSA